MLNIDIRVLMMMIVWKVVFLMVVVSFMVLFDVVILFDLSSIVIVRVSK